MVQIIPKIIRQLLIQMETSNKRLDNIMSQITLIYIDSQKKISLEKKLENYNKGNLLISEALHLIEKMQTDITNLAPSTVNKSQINKIGLYLEMLSMPNPKFDEIMYIIEQLTGVNSGLSTSTQIIDNVEQEVIRENGTQ